VEGFPAGALRRHRLPVLVFAGFSTILSALIVGYGLWALLPLLGVALPLAWCLVFIHIGSRKVFVSPATLNPHDAWVRQQGRNLLMWLDELMLHVPVVKGIYGATKQLINAIQSNQDTEAKGGGFKEVVVVDWPHPGSYTLGFVAHRDCAWAVEGGEGLVAVYVPTAPNPTSGYVVMIEASKIRPAHISPDQALTWAVSGGVIVPNHIKLPQSQTSGRKAEA
jgi:hypothetical protein